MKRPRIVVGFGVDRRSNGDYYVKVDDIKEEILVNKTLCSSDSPPLGRWVEMIVRHDSGGYYVRDKVHKIRHLFPAVEKNGYGEVLVEIKYNGSNLFSQPFFGLICDRSGVLRSAEIGSWYWAWIRSPREKLKVEGDLVNWEVVDLPTRSDEDLFSADRFNVHPRNRPFVDGIVTSRSENGNYDLWTSANRSILLILEKERSPENQNMLGKRVRFILEKDIIRGCVEIIPEKFRTEIVEENGKSHIQVRATFKHVRTIDGERGFFESDYFGSIIDSKQPLVRVRPHATYQAWITPTTERERRNALWKIVSDQTFRGYNDNKDCMYDRAPFRRQALGELSRGGDHGAVSIRGSETRRHQSTSSSSSFPQHMSSFSSSKHFTETTVNRNERSNPIYSLPEYFEGLNRPSQSKISSLSGRPAQQHNETIENANAPNKPISQKSVKKNVLGQSIGENVVENAPVTESTKGETYVPSKQPRSERFKRMDAFIMRSNPFGNGEQLRQYPFDDFLNISKLLTD